MNEAKLLIKMYKLTVCTLLNKLVGADLRITLESTNKLNKPVPNPRQHPLITVVPDISINSHQALSAIRSQLESFLSDDG